MRGKVRRVKKLERLRELAEQHGIKTTKRLFVEDSDGKTVFFDVDKTREQLVLELEEKGAL